MKIIRGATTVLADSPEEIKRAVKELLDEIFSKNKLEKAQTVGLAFSMTQDLVSFHPAKAARETGYDFAPLFACQEPKILHALEKCLRVMVFAETNEKVKHIYLRGATVLRKDLTKINITLDGPAGSGKSTVAKRIANDYGILYLDTGAMYRATALFVLENGVSPKDRNAVCALLPKLDVKVKYLDGTQHTYLGERDVSEAIRKNEVSQCASDVSVHPCVRNKMVELQREIASNISCVLDGRDIGSTVLPNADFKFFITADSKVRAKRRYDELLLRGQEANLDEIHAQILARDKQDTEREFSPLKQAEDAIFVDTSAMSIDEVVSKIKAIIQTGI